MKVEKQISVFIDNRPGLFAKVCSIMSEAGINIKALSIHDTVDHKVIRFLPSNHNKALLLLEEESFYCHMNDVVMMEVENAPGILSRISQKLARADINIEYAYCTATERQSLGCLVLRTKEPERAIESLTSF